MLLLLLAGVVFLLFNLLFRPTDKYIEETMQDSVLEVKKQVNRPVFDSPLETNNNMKRIAEEQKLLQEKELLNTLKAYKKNDLQALLTIYLQLHKLNDKNTYYLKQIKEYQEAIAQQTIQTQQLLADHIHKYGHAPVIQLIRSTYNEINQYWLQQYAKLPYQQKCDEAQLHTDGWLIQCIVQFDKNKNNLSAQSYQFILQHGVIQKIIHEG